MTHAIIAACLVSATLSGVAPTIEQSDWMSTDKNVFLAFRPAETNETGEAWYIKWVDGTLYACSGHFTYIKPNVVRLAITRTWRPRFADKTNIWWAYDDHHAYRTGGKFYSVDLEIDRMTDAIVVTAVSVDSIDQYGDSIGADRVRVSPYHFSAGEVVEFRPSKGFKRLNEFLPPGYSPRDQWMRVTKQSVDKVKISDFFDKDWYGWSYDEELNENTVSEAKYQVLSLRPTDGWSRGTAWLVTMGDTWIDAQKGTFALYNNKLAIQDVAMLSLTFLRHYKGEYSRNNIVWKLNTRNRDNHQVTLDIPLNERDLDNNFTSYMSDIQFVNENGNVTTKYDRAPGLLSLPEKRTVTRSQNNRLSETFRFQVSQPLTGIQSLSKKENFYSQMLRGNPPPGLRLKEVVPTRITVLKPVQTVDADTAMARANKLFTDRRYSEAVTLLDALLKYEPKNVAALFLRANAIYWSGDDAQAYDAFTHLISLRPSPTMLAACFSLRGNIFERRQEYNKARIDWLLALKDDFKKVKVLNSMAWLLATCPEDSIRNGKQAIIYATAACELSKWSQPAYIDSLAAAYAEQGDFEKAIKWQQKAIALAPENEKQNYRSRLVKFHIRKPIRE